MHWARILTKFITVGRNKWSTYILIIHSVTHSLIQVTLSPKSHIIEMLRVIRLGKENKSTNSMYSRPRRWIYNNQTRTHQYSFLSLVLRRTISPNLWIVIIRITIPCKQRITVPFRWQAELTRLIVKIKKSKLRQHWRKIRCTPKTTNLHGTHWLSRCVVSFVKWLWERIKQKMRAQ